MVARKGRRFSGKRLQPPLPEAKEEPVIPKYFSMIRGSGYGKAEEERIREIIPGPMPRAGETPSAIHGGRPMIPPTPFPSPAPEPERVPLLIRATRYIGTLLGVEPERPVSMPVVPELNFPTLYTRFPTMKTVTKTTDVAGEIAVTYSHSFATIPGVVITVKDPDNVFGTVFATTLTGFEVRLFKIDHNHGGTVDDDGAHTPTINADGDHVHNVQGTGSVSLDTNYGRLVMANYTDYEKLHKHANITSGMGSAHRHVNNPTGYESAHTHTNPSTGTESNHTHTIPATDGPDDTMDAITYINFGSACVSGACVTGGGGDTFALDTHWHLNTGKATGADGGHSHSIGDTGTGSSHRHTVGDTQLESAHTHHIYPTGVGTYANPLGHRHLISSDALYNHYVYDVDLTLDLVTSVKESPYHAHTGGNIVDHGHVVPSDGRVLLKSTNVTITYMAQEEEN